MKAIATLAATGIAIAAMSTAQAQDIRFISNDTDCGAEFTVAPDGKVMMLVNIETAQVSTGLRYIPDSVAEAAGDELFPVTFTFDDGTQTVADLGSFMYHEGYWMSSSWSDFDAGLDALDAMGNSKGMDISFSGLTYSVIDGVWVSNGYNHMLSCMEQRSPLMQ